MYALRTMPTRRIRNGAAAFASRMRSGELSWIATREKRSSRRK